MGFGKSFKKIGAAAINPVGAGIKRLTGVSQGKQLAMGAGIGSAAVLRRAAASRAPGIPGLQGGEPLVDGAIGSTGTTGGRNFMSMFSGMAPSLIGAAGSVYSARRSAEGQEAANDAGLASAREQMAFQDRMSSTAHQREVDDLRAAGLNPVLSSNSGASTPVGSSFEPTNAAPNYGNVVASAIAAKQLDQDVRESNSRIVVNRETARRTGVEADLATAHLPEATLRSKLWQSLSNGWNSAKSFFLRKTREASDTFDRWDDDDYHRKRGRSIHTR
jgi:hypothetical protein